MGFWPLVTLSDEQRHHFETVEGELAGWPEVGSRALQRVEMLDGMPMVGSWLIDLLDDEEAMGYVQSLGYRQAPVVVTDEGQHWSGYQPGRVAALR